MNDNLKNFTISSGESNESIDDRFNSSELLDFVINLVNKEEKDKIVKFFKRLHPADIAEIN